MKIDFKFPEVVDIKLLKPNSYNPNVMPKKEMELLKACIAKYGFLFPILVNKENGMYVIIDGYHRYETLKRMKSNKALIIALDLSMEERIQLTILMNRIKGMHQVERMSENVIELVKLGVKPVDVAKALGMEGEEFIRLNHQKGIAHSFRNHEYSNSWETK